jgi:hypothetical protein
MDNKYNVDNEYNEKTIVTLAIITHGGVIQFDLHQNMQSLFQYVRLFSKAGDFKATCTTPSEDNAQLTLLYSYLRKNLNKETFLALEDYEKKVGGKMIEHITFDKIFRVDESTNVEGIFLVSIHRKKTLDNYELIWPKDSKYALNINLLDFEHPSNWSEFDLMNMVKLKDDYIEHNAMHELVYSSCKVDRSNPLVRDSFTRENFLKHVGLGEDDWYVAVHIRNTNYRFDERKVAQSKFNPALEAIIKAGGRIIQFGLNMTKVQLSDRISHFRATFDC